MKIYNTYSKKDEEFSLEGNIVRMYNCGPTVYDYAHIGNFRSFLLADLLRRYFEYKGYTVKQVMNFTDVGHMTLDDLDPTQAQQQKNVDKMALAAQKTGIQDPRQLADRFIEAFLEDSKTLRCLEPMKRPRASEHVNEMIEIISKLIEKGHAYEVDGFVYFAENSFPDYGRLSGNTSQDLIAGHRVEVDPRKKNPTDFSLWKHGEKHIMKWPSPWGMGFPGWHIECSAMAMKYLGETLDIHTGGEDNIFPHHEAEIAQSECCTGKTFSRYWVHARHLLVDGTKMSKSKGNFFTVRELINKGYRGEEIRYALISTHYKQKMNFTTGLGADATREDYAALTKIQALEEARAALKRIGDFIDCMSDVQNSGESSSEFTALHARTCKGFNSEMDDNLNVAGALGMIFQFIREVNAMNQAGTLVSADARRAVETIKDFDQVLSVLPEGQEEVPQEVWDLTAQRKQARQDKNYAELMRSVIR